MSPTIINKLHKKTESLVDRTFNPISEKISNLETEVDKIYDKNKITEIQMFIRKEVYPLPPYNFTHKLINFINDELKKEKIDESNIIVKSFNQLLKEITDQDINKYLRIIKIDDLLMHLVEHTDNEIFYRPLITPTMFIDNEIWFKDEMIKGITIVDLEFYNEFILKFEESIKIKIEPMKENYFIFFFMINKINYDISYDFFTLEYDMANTNKELKQYLRNVICNVLDMIYAMDDKLNITIIETAEEQNIKRIKRDQIPIPTKIFIKPKDEFKQYVYKFVKDMEDGIRKIGHKFLVRGHWRHFRAERYKQETRETPVWIKPFWKGEGIMIAKEYMITK